MSTGILPRCVADTPIAVIDFETTGLAPGYDRVVEVSVVRVEPGQRPKVVFDTLVNPERHVDATFIHGITDADVADAPRFRDIAGGLLAATAGCVIASYNIYFDISFLNFELESAGVSHEPPHFCLMYLRPLLGLGSICKLDEACREHGVKIKPTHMASTDALAASHLLRVYLKEIRRLGISTFSDLAQRKPYKFTKSFSLRPFPGPAKFSLRRRTTIVSRSKISRRVP